MKKVIKKYRKAIKSFHSTYYDRRKPIEDIIPHDEIKGTGIQYDTNLEKLRERLSKVNLNKEKKKYVKI